MDIESFKEIWSSFITREITQEDLDEQINKNPNFKKEYYSQKQFATKNV